ncbi:hypothetical protein SRHO_G00332050 [Serrasalmus rhombeus]
MQGGHAQLLNGHQKADLLTPVKQHGLELKLSLHPFPPSAPLRSSGAFLNILPMSALSLINVKHRARATTTRPVFSTLPPQRSYISLFLRPIHMGKKKGPGVQHERDET